MKTADYGIEAITDQDRAYIELGVSAHVLIAYRQIGGSPLISPRQQSTKPIFFTRERNL